MTPRLSTSALAVFSLLLFAGCSDDGPNGDPSGGGTTIPVGGGAVEVSAGDVQLTFEFPASAAGLSVTLTPISGSAIGFADEDFVAVVRMAPDGHSFDDPVRVRTDTGDFLAFNFPSGSGPQAPEALELSADGEALELSHFSALALRRLRTFEAGDAECATGTTSLRYAEALTRFCHDVEASCCSATDTCRLGSLALSLRTTRLRAAVGLPTYCGESTEPDAGTDAGDAANDAVDTTPIEDVDDEPETSPPDVPAELDVNDPDTTEPDAEVVDDATDVPTDAEPTDCSDEWTLLGAARMGAMFASAHHLRQTDDGTLEVFYLEENTNESRLVRFVDDTWTSIPAGALSGLLYFVEFAEEADGDMLMVYTDYRGAGPERPVSAMRFDGSSWQPLGGSVSPTYSYSNAIAVAPDGTIYVVYTIQSTGFIGVGRLDGETWTDLEIGVAGFADHVAAAVTSTGDLLVAYQDGGASNGVTVMRYSDSSWERLGVRGFSDGTAEGIVLAIAPDDTPYVAFTDGSITSTVGLSMLRFDGESWAHVGDEATVSEGPAFDPALAFHDGDVYVSFMDYGAPFEMNRPISVRRFNGSGWEYVGERGLRPGSSANSSMVFADDGALLVAYADLSVFDDGRTTVMRWLPCP